LESDEREDLDPGAETGERRLLIHPCRDQVEIFFVYRPDQPGIVMFPAGDISSTSIRKADESIDIYGLNRFGLVKARGDQ
jgi:hypothetical protein